ncbi:MAG TPA: histidine kinase [Phnomibacter sp.]|nr:histidine kinase [Phnomibacter sp.]
MWNRILLVIGLQMSLVLMAHATDTLMILDKVPVWVTGAGASQAEYRSRMLTLYHNSCQLGLAGGPGYSTNGTALIWNRETLKYWQQRLEFGVAAATDTPKVWHAIQPGALVIDTLLQPGASFSFWLRLPAQQLYWRMLTAWRPLLVPRWGGYSTRLVADTAELGLRLQNVARYQGAQIAWKAVSGNLPDIRPGHTLELYFERQQGIADSSLEYRLLSNDEPYLTESWQPTGHLLRLPSLAPGHSYRLEIRYQHMPEMVSQRIITMPSWYQQPLWVGVLVLCTCLLVGILLYLRYRRRLSASRKDHAALQDQLRRLEAQLNPHFVYNALGSIGGLMSQSKYAEADLYLGEFGKLLRATMNYSRLDRSYSLAAEISMLENYCRLEQLRFGFTYHIAVDSKLVPDEVLLPPMLVQPLVENAIRHGVQRVSKGGEISIQYKRLTEEDGFQVLVTDNGPDWHQPSKHEGTGTGLLVTKQRIQYLNALYSHAEIRFELNRAGQQTVATLSLLHWLA